MIRVAVPGLMKQISQQPDGSEVFEQDIVLDSDRILAEMVIADW
jgi:hypothetical protein